MFICVYLRFISLSRIERAAGGASLRALRLPLFRIQKSKLRRKLNPARRNFTPIANGTFLNDGRGVLDDLSDYSSHTPSHLFEVCLFHSADFCSQKPNPPAFPP